MSIEDDREHLHRILLDFRIALDSQSPARLTALLSKYTTTSDKAVIASLVHSEEAHNVFIHLISFHSFFHLSSPMSQRWIKDDIFSIAGGVSFSHSNSFLYSDKSHTHSSSSDSSIILSTAGTDSCPPPFYTTLMDRTTMYGLNTVSPSRATTKTSCPKPAVSLSLHGILSPYPTPKRR